MEGQPFVGLKFGGQSAIDDAGFAGTGGAIYQDEVGLIDHLVEGFNFRLASEEDIAVIAVVGIQKFERIFALDFHEGRA